MVLSGACGDDETGCDPVRLQSATVTSSIFPLLGASPAIGRTFSAAEDRRGGDNRVVVISHDLWARRFASDPRLPGRKITLDGESYTVVGVMPAAFDFPAPAELWVPLVLDPSRDRDEHDLTVIGRLGPGVTIDRADDDVRRVAGQLAAEYPRTSAGWSARLVTFTDWIIGPQLERAVFVLMGAVGFLLLMACANIANLLIARGNARRREVGVRAALGASSARLTRQFLTESILLALLGALVGLGVAVWGTELVRVFGPANIPRLDEVSVDGRVLGFTLMVALSTSILFGLTPALQISRVDLHSILEHGARGGTTRDRAGIRDALVVIQVALAMVLLAAAALMFGSFVRLERAPLGFDASNVLTVPLQLPEERYGDEQREAFFETVLTRVSGIPGVTSSGATSTDPLRQWGFSNDVTPEDRAAEAPAGGYMQAGWRSVTPGFFDAMGIPLLQGRTLKEMDRAGGERAVDRALPVPDVRSLRENRSAAVAEPRFRMLLLGGFAAAALFLAAVGIYGVMAFTVAQRSREIGVRIALGAHARRVFTLVLEQGIILAGIGVAVGLAGAIAVTRIPGSLLYGVSATDPVAFMAATLLLGAVTLAGAYLPARRAARIDPVVALREE